MTFMSGSKKALLNRISWVALRVFGGLIVLAGSFLITLNLLDLGTSTYDDGINRPTPDFLVADVGTKPDALTCRSSCEKEKLCSSWICIKVSSVRPAPLCL